MPNGRSLVGSVIVGALLGAGSLGCTNSSASGHDAAAASSGGAGMGARGGSGTASGGVGGASVAAHGGNGNTTGNAGSGGGPGATAGNGGAISSGGGNSGGPGNGGAPAPSGVPGCSVDGWCWRNPSPQGNTLRGVFAASASRAWAVGDHGALVGWDGTRWAALVSGTDFDLVGIWGTNATEVWAGGAKGTVLIGNGATWALTATGGDRSVKGVWASGSNLLAVDDVGEVYQRPRSATGAWVRLTSGSYSLLVTAFFADAGGHAFVNDGYSGGKVRTWTGTAWGGPFGPQVTSLWADSNGTFWTWSTLDELESFDATTTTAPVSRGSSPDAAIWGPGPGDVWVAGSDGHAYRWNGGMWTNFGPITDAAQKPGLFGISGSSATDVWAVGDGGTIMHFDGQAWSSAASGSRAHLQAVWGSAPDDVWAGGSSSTLLHGPGFPASTLAVPAAIAVNITDLFGTGPNTVWAATTNSDLGQWDGATWTLAKAMPGVSHIWAAGSEVWLGGTYDVVGRWNGTAFEPHPTGVVAAGTALWGTGPSDIWVGTGGGTSGILHWNGSAWAATSIAIGGIRDIHGSGANDVWAVGDIGGALAMPNLAAHFDGTQWTTMPTGVTVALVSVWTNGPTSAWAVGVKGTILFWNGQTWVPSQSGTAQALNAVWSTDSKTFVVGTWGTILER